MYVDLNKLSLLKLIYGTWLVEIAKEINRVLLKNAKFQKWFKIENFQKIAKTKCREICEPQNREINVSRKFHVIRYFNTNMISSTFIDVSSIIKMIEETSINIEEIIFVFAY